jgi:hypothetical protein
MSKVIWIVVCSAVSISVACAAQSSSQGQSQAQPADSQPGPQQPAVDSQAKPETKPAPPTPIAIKKAELGDDNSWNQDWDKVIEKSLPPELLSSKMEREVKGLCPRFKQMSEVDRRAFWAYFFQALAGAEAGLRATATVRHSEPEVAVIDPATHRVARQEGLLQLAYTDSERYGCDFDWEKDKALRADDPEKTILLPKNNLECGIKILDNQLITRHQPLLSKSSYWETLRPGRPGFAVFVKQLANMPAACGASRYRHPGSGATPEPAPVAGNQPEGAPTPATAGQPPRISKTVTAEAPAAGHPN